MTLSFAAVAVATKISMRFASTTSLHCFTFRLFACALLFVCSTTVNAQVGRRGLPAPSQTIEVPLAVPPDTPPRPSSNFPKASNYEPTPEELERERQAAAECRAVILDTEGFAEVIRGGKVFLRREVTTPARISARPEPRYTKAARAGGVSGTVRLRLILAADGSVSHIEALDRLPYGLTRESIRAACKIRFQPAMKDGQAVAQQVMVMYGFQIYDRLPLGGYPPIGIRQP